MTANLAAIMAERGMRVGVIDADVQSPGIHVILGVPAEDVRASLNDFLWGSRALSEVALDVTDLQPVPLPGRILFIPSSMEPGQITRVLREGYDAARLTKGIRELGKELRLDVLLVDTHPGLNEETLLSLVISHALLVIMRPDRQDYEGTGVTVRVARELSVPRIMIAVNKTPEAFDADVVTERVRNAYGCEVVGVIRHSDDLMELSSEGVFSLRYPDHPVSDAYRQIASAVMAGANRP